MGCCKKWKRKKACKSCPLLKGLGTKKRKRRVTKLRAAG